MDRIEKLKEFMDLQPGDSFLQHALALEYIKLGNDTEALLVFQDLLSSNENYIGSYYHLATLLERLEKKEDAIAAYETGIKKARDARSPHSLSQLQSAY